MPGAIRWDQRNLPSRPNAGILIAVQNVHIVRSVRNASVIRPAEAETRHPTAQSIVAVPVLTPVSPHLE